MKYERLFTPIEINGMRLKNRLVEAAIQLHYCPDGHANEKITELENRLASRDSEQR